jgi:hypothetical protein
MSFQRDNPHRKSRNRTMRMAPSTRLNRIWLPKTGAYLFSPVTATRGTNL